MKKVLLMSAGIGVVLLVLWVGKSRDFNISYEETEKSETNETYIDEPTTTKLSNDLTFSNTQTWDPVFFAKISTPAVFTKDQLATVQLPPPPTNDSTTTSAELAGLHAKVALRTTEKLAEIQNELSLGTSVFGDTTLSDQSKVYDRPYTTALAQMVLKLADPIILEQKQKFNRVRPSHLDPTLSLAIDLPNHPAYPSGHSTQAHLIAGVLSTLDPQHRDDYFLSAKRIAENREIAGVHYPSDTKAGILLAEQILPLLFTNEDFTEVYREAEKEWNSGL